MNMFDAISNVFDAPRLGFGLDYGTSFSQVAVQDGASKPVVAPYSGENRHGIPSLFYRAKDGNEFCADKAAGPATRDPANACRSVKMKLSEKSIVLNGHSYTPFEIAEKEVKYILDASKKAFDTDFITFNPKAETITVGVPCRFNAAECGQIKQIVLNAMGGGNVLVRKEPSLAGVAYDYFSNDSSRSPAMCFDIGGGTFDVCVMEYTPDAESPYTVCDGADGLRIAGDRFNELTAELILSILRKDPGNLDLSRLTDPANRAEYCNFLELARKLKEELSNDEVCTMPITTLDGKQSSRVTVTRKQFEAAIKPCVSEMIELSKKVVKTSGHWGDSSLRILMVGGSCQIPLIRKMLEKEFSWAKEPLLRNPQQMVALGAAIYSRMPHKALTEKIAFGYGVRTHISSRKEEVICVEIPSNAALPAKSSRCYKTLNDNQNCIIFNIYEVDHGEAGSSLKLEDGRDMGQGYFIKHEFGRAVPKGTMVWLNTELSTDGILTMTVNDIGISGMTTKTFTLVNVGIDG